MTPQQEMAKRSRRDFLVMGVSAAAGFGAWSWLRSRPRDGQTPWPFRDILHFNEKVVEAGFSNGHLAPLFPAERAAEPIVNGDIGLDESYDASQWQLSVQGRTLGIGDIRSLPRVEQTTELNCIEGWTTVVHWTGARFSDFTSRYFPDAMQAPYVSMATPDQKYFVGLDRASAMHPQTLLCYEMNGEPLTSGHGAPLRLVIPVKYGVKNIKRIATIAYTNERPRDFWAEQGYDWYAGL